MNLYFLVLWALPLIFYLCLSFMGGAILISPVHFQSQNTHPTNEPKTVDYVALYLVLLAVSIFMIWNWYKGPSADLVLPFMLVVWWYVVLVWWYCKLGLNNTGVNHTGFRFFFLTVILVNSFLLVPYVALSAALASSDPEMNLFLFLPSSYYYLILAESLAIVSLVVSFASIRFRSTG